MKKEHISMILGLISLLIIILSIISINTKLDRLVPNLPFGTIFFLASPLVLAGLFLGLESEKSKLKTSSLILNGLLVIFILGLGYTQLIYLM